MRLLTTVAAALVSALGHSGSSAGVDRLREPRRRLQGQLPRHAGRRRHRRPHLGVRRDAAGAGCVSVARDQERYSVTVVDYRGSRSC